MKWLVKTCLFVMGIGLIGCVVFGAFLEQSGENVDWSEYFSWNILGSSYEGTVEFVQSVDELSGAEQVGSQTQEITGLDFEIGAAKLIVVEGDTFSVEVKGKRNPVNSYVSGGIWYLETQTKAFSFMSGTDTITVTIPKGVFFEIVYIEVGAGEAQLCELKANEVYLTVGAGNCATERLDILGHFDIEVGMGNFEGSCTAPADIYLNCGMGNVDLKIGASEREYWIDADCGLGNVKAGSLDISGVGDGSREPYNPESEKTLGIDCGLGNVTVDFLE